MEIKSTDKDHLQLQLQDLIFAKLNKTRKKILERTSEEASTTGAVMSTIKKIEHNCIPRHLHNKHSNCQVNT